MQIQHDNHSALVADLMSRGAQTVEPDAQLKTIIRKLRLIGHEGFPVVENGRIVGLLTRRDADRALEHGLDDLTVRDVMSAGEVTLRADDPVLLLQRRMVESGWGQIPVVDGEGKLIGIVTRTDLINYWAEAAPGDTGDAERVTDAQIAAVLGEPVARLVRLIAEEAQAKQTNLYMVGGVVRDLLLKRANDDVDFVVEGDAITFAGALSAKYGGEVHSYRPFGTATWTLEATRIYATGMPASVDFASARSEFYEHPTALPTVYSGSIKLDLHRRDFTINTLAVLLSPVSGRVVDYYGGLADLRAGLIRVLHSLSFVDDPTRILRAVRFERRLGFTIEPRTMQLIETALPMLRRITGERIRNELTLLMAEADPAGSFLLLQARGILEAIDPALHAPHDLAERFAQAQVPPPWVMPTPDANDVRWGLLLASLPPEQVEAVCERLHFGKGLSETLVAAARIVEQPPPEEATPSQVVAHLEGANDLALYTAWLLLESPVARHQIWQYGETWRYVKPQTDGHTLRERGLKPGPCYSRILTRLRAARLDGEAPSDADEALLLSRLLEEGICDDGD